MAQRNNPNDDFQLKIDRTFPEDGVIFFPKAGNEGLKEILLTGRAFAIAILKHVPHSRERSLAFSRLEEALVWVIFGLMRR